MFFILQKDNDFTTLDIELYTLQKELNKQKFQHQYTFMSKEEFIPGIKYSIKNIEEAVPVGSIEFISNYLKCIHNIDNMNPIEVPNELRLPKFLCREYSIVTSDKLPKEGNYFIKDVSKLKEFSYCGNVQYIENINKNHLFQVSEIKNILAEYRVMVLNDEIKGIQFYDGNPTIMPTPNEINKLKEAICRYEFNNTRPKAYALDIGIIETIEGRDLMIIESCPFVSLGTYGLVGSFLPYMYRQGLDWYIKYNTPIQTFNIK